MPTDKKPEIADLILSVLAKEKELQHREAKTVIGYFSLGLFFEHPIELFWCHF